METVLKIELKEDIDSSELIEGLRCRIESQDHQIKLLEEKIHYLLHYRFGAKSEHSDDRQALLFVNEYSPSDTEDTVTEIEVPAYTRKKGGRRIPPKELPHVRVEHDLPEDEKLCECHHQLSRSGEEVSYQYDVIPTKFPVIENVRFKYVCSNAACEHLSKTAKQDPPAPLPRTQASPGLLAWVGASKFVDGMPLNRIAHVAEHRFGAPFTSTTLASWMIKASDRIISPIVDAMEQALYKRDYIHCDETTLQVLNEKGRTAKQKSFIWCRVTGDDEAPIVLMNYSSSRAGAVASKLLDEFSGYLQTDGYVGYNPTAVRPDITQLGCWTHTRRKFVDAERNSADSAARIASEGARLIRGLYRLDNKGKKKPPKKRQRYRQRVVKPHLDKIRDWIDENRNRALAYGGLLATAFTYIHNQWEKLIVFIEDHRLSLDNNKAERHIRPIALGIKVWLFAKSEAGAKATALWYSLIETAKANGLEPYWYLRKVFAEMPVYLRDKKPVDDLLPWNIV